MLTKTAMQALNKSKLATKEAKARKSALRMKTVGKQRMNTKSIQTDKSKCTIFCSSNPYTKDIKTIYYKQLRSICRGNCIVLSAITDKHTRVSFLKLQQAKYRKSEGRVENLA